MRVIPGVRVEIVPMADGGDGTLEALLKGTGGRLRSWWVTGPMGERVRANWGVLGDGETAVIELAKASGLALVPVGMCNPLISTTYGTGELIRRVLDLGFRRILIGIGGSATNDGGAGIAQAVGARLLNRKGAELAWGGAALINLEHIDIAGVDRRIKECRIGVACDVSNPLCGPEGASVVYSPQKGATPQGVEVLEKALRRYAEVIQKELGLDVEDMPFTGAAGGAGVGVLAFLGAELFSGVELISEVLRLGERFEGASLVITGEGRIDSQTAYGKTAVGVAKRAKALGIPTVALAGTLGDGYEEVYKADIDAVTSILSRPMTLEEAQEKTASLLEESAERLTRLLMTGKRMK